MSLPDLDLLLERELGVGRAAVVTMTRVADVRLPIDQAQPLQALLDRMHIPLSVEDRLSGSFPYGRLRVDVVLRAHQRDYVVAIAQAALEHDAAAGETVRFDGELVTRVGFARFGVDVTSGEDWNAQYHLLMPRAQSVLRAGRFGTPLVPGPQADILATLLTDRCDDPHIWSGAIDYLSHDPDALVAARSLAAPPVRVPRPVDAAGPEVSR